MRLTTANHKKSNAATRRRRPPKDAPRRRVLRLRRLVRAIAACLRRRAPQHTPLVEALEPRMLLSAELGLGLDAPRDLADNDAGQPMPDGVGLASITAVDAADSASPNALELDALGAMGSGPDNADRSGRELVFVDTGVEGYAEPIEDLRDRNDSTELTVIMLDATKDGIQQIDAALSAARDVDAVHIISHGSTAGVQLGSTWLTSDNLDDYAEVVAGWSDAFSTDGDLLLYGCNLAADAGGRGLLDTLAELTGTDVAASEDLTGHKTLGGDWDLEYTVGTIESPLAVSTAMQQRFAGVLGQITVTTGADVLDGDADTASLAALAINPGADGEISLREAIEAANTDIGADAIFLAADTYTITRSGVADDGGDFDIRDDLSIVGVSPTQSIVDANDVDRAFDVHDDAAITVSFSGLKIEAGSVSGTEDGGAIKIRAGANTPEVFLSDAWLTGNDASGATSYGGAIRNDANLTIVNLLIDGNTGAEGGGVFNESGANLTMVNVTVSGNDAQNGDGGGLFNAGNATLRHVTIADNTATNEDGGVRDDLAGAVTDVANSIIAGNTAGSGSNDFFGAIASSGSNIIGDDTGASGSFDASDQRNVDPLLGSLANNGGALMTHAPAAAEAIGTADDALASDFDQNGLLRDGAPDIGAHEVGAATALPELTLHISTKDRVVAGGLAGSRALIPGRRKT